MRRRPLLALATLCALATSPLSADSERARIAWLQAHAAPLETLDPDAPIDDLAFLSESLAGARVVLLGEATRGDGSTLLAKTRFLRYLHERLGFDLLAFEGGFYDSARAWREIRAGGDPREALRGAWLPLYTEAAEMQPLLRYLSRRAAGDRPLEVAGIDAQGSPEWAGAHLLDDLRESLGGAAIDGDDAAALARLAPIVRDVAAEAYATGASEAPPLEEQRAVHAAIDRLRSALAERAGDDAAFASQALVNFDSWAESSWRLGRWSPGMKQPSELFNRRDAQMADNLLWLAARHPERKIVVWAQTIHVVRATPELDSSDAAIGARLGRMSVLGERAAVAFGDAAYAIGFTAATGANATPFRAASQLLTPTRGSFEDLMTRAGFGAAFVDLRRRVAGGDWLARPLVAKPVTYVELRGRWPRHLDGLLFVREMQPVHRAEPAPPPTGR